MTKYKLTFTLIVTFILAKPALAGSPFDKFARKVQSSAQRYRGNPVSRTKQPRRSTTPRFDTQMGLPQKYRSGSKSGNGNGNGGGNRTLPFPGGSGSIKDRIKDEIRRHIEVPCHKPRPCPNPVILPIPHPCPEPVVDPLPSPCPEPIEEPVLPPTEDPAPEAGAEDVELPVVYEGQTVTLPAEGMGELAGRVAIKFGPISANASIVTWGPKALVFTAPSLGLAEPAAATIVVTAADGSPLGEIAIRFAPPAAPQVPQVPVGSQLTLNGEGFGPTQGLVWVKIGTIRLRATIISWTPTSAVVELPTLDLAAPTAAELLVLASDGREAERADVQLVAAR